MVAVALDNPDSNNRNINYIRRKFDVIAVHLRIRMKEMLFLTLLLSVLFISGGVIGFSVAKIIEGNKDAKKVLNGMWMNERNWSDAYKTAKDRDSNGEWICVNLANMEYNDMVTTIQHEVAHELFAEKCENNITKCIEAVNI